MSLKNNWKSPKSWEQACPSFQFEDNEQPKLLADNEQQQQRKQEKENHKKINEHFSTANN